MSFFGNQDNHLYPTGLILSLLAMLLTQGCASNGYSTRENGEINELNVATTLKFEDVPIPAGFRILSDQSFSFQNEMTRVGVLK